MSGPGETKLRRNIKEAARLGEASFVDSDFGDDKYRPGDEIDLGLGELDEGELWFADSLAEG